LRTGRQARDRRNQARLCGAAALVFVLSVGGSVFAAMALAAPPSNDNFANAQTLSGAFPIVVHGTLSEATQEPGEPEDQYGASVWYSWTAPSTGRVTIDTCGGQSFAPITFVYTGPSVSQLQQVSAEEDFEHRSACPLPDPEVDQPGDIQRVTEFVATAGTTYRIQAVSGDSFALVLKDPEVYDLAVSQSVSRRTVPFGGALNEVMRITNRGNIALPVPRTQVNFGQEINKPGRPHDRGKAVYAFARSPGGRCSHGIFGGGSRIQTFACKMTPLAPGESQVAQIRITRIKGNLLLDAHLAIFDGSFRELDDRRGNDDAQTIIRVRGR
jgi:hypothetical protein